MNLHLTLTLTLLLSLPMLLIAEQMYIAVSSLNALVIVRFTLTFVTLQSSIRLVILSLTDTLSLKAPIVLLHTIVGKGIPTDSQVNVMLPIPSSMTVSLTSGVMIFG